MGANIVDWIGLAEKAGVSIVGAGVGAALEEPWKADVLDKLRQINHKLDLLLDEVRALREQVARLPVEIDNLLRDLEEAKVVAAWKNIEEILGAIDPKKIPDDAQEELETYCAYLATQEGVLEAKWSFTPWWIICSSTLTRVFIYRLLAEKEKYWFERTRAALDRRITYLMLGCDESEGGIGPARDLTVRLTEVGETKRLVEPCLGTTVQICHARVEIGQPYEGMNYSWHVWTQPRIEGSLESGRIWMDLDAEKQPEILTANSEPKPPFPGKLYEPVGCPEITMAQYYGYKGIILDKRRVIEGDMVERARKYVLMTDTIKHLTPIVAGMRRMLALMQEMRREL